MFAEVEFIEPAPAVLVGPAPVVEYLVKALAVSVSPAPAVECTDQAPAYSVSPAPVVECIEPGLAWLVLTALECSSRRLPCRFCFRQWRNTSHQLMQ